MDLFEWADSERNVIYAEWQFKKVALAFLTDMLFGKNLPRIEAVIYYPDFTKNHACNDTALSGSMRGNA